MTEPNTHVVPARDRIATAASRRGFGTRAVRGWGRADARQPSLLTPIVQSATFAQAAPGESAPHTYSRASNPTVDALERSLGALEDAPPAVAFASGLAATHALALAHLAAGDHAVLGRACYGGTVRLFRQVLAPLGIDASFVDATDLTAVGAALTARTRLILVETPSNPTLDVVDLAALARLARAARVPLAVDNTFLTAYHQVPLDHGADLSLLSTTKWIDGHNATVGGAVVTRDEALLGRLRFLRKTVGSIQAPLDAWLTLQGSKTLAVRLERHAASALELGRWLERQPGIVRVRYPGLPSHPGHGIARLQHRNGHGGVLAFELDGGREAAVRLARRLELVTLAESLGGAESLLTHPTTMTHGDVPEGERSAIGIVDGLLRLSVGLEDVTDLRDDLGRALAPHARVVAGGRSPRELHVPRSAVRDGESCLRAVRDAYLAVRAGDAVSVVTDSPRLASQLTRAGIRSALRRAIAPRAQGPASAPRRDRDGNAPSRRPRVALLGLGVVGGGVYAHLRALGDEIELVGIAVRDLAKDRSRDIGLPVGRSLLGCDAARLAVGADIVIEALGGIDPAHAIVAAALARGADVITANKALIAAHGESLLTLAAESGATLRHSAAVGGSAPCIELVRSCRTQGTVARIDGILNGTCQWILNRLASRGGTLDDAVTEARRRGFCERDPARDLGGLDALDKLTILCREAFGEPPRAVTLAGIRDVDAAQAADHVRLVARAERRPGGVVASVGPERVDADCPLRELNRADGCGNGLSVTLAGGERRVALGLGAGRWPTAVSVAADIADSLECLRSRGTPQVAGGAR